MLRSRHAIASLLFTGCLATLTAAGRTVPAPVDAISTGELERRLRFIASDALEGRESLSPGYRAAVAYLASELGALGLTPRGDNGSYLQRVTMRRSVVEPAGTHVEVSGRAYVYGEDLLASGSGTVSGRVVYVGHGYRIPSKQIDPYAGLDVRGAILLVLPGLPEGMSWRDIRRLGEKTGYWSPADNAEAFGAVGVIRIASFDDLAGWQRTRARQTATGTVVVDRLSPETSSIPSVTAGPRLLAALMTGERESGTRLHERAGQKDPGPSFALSPAKRVTIAVASRVTRDDTFNVVASVDGSDRSPEAGFVALGAHLDHIGVEPDLPQDGSGDAAGDRINNGADDDGSGVVALVEIAAAAMRAPRPQRSLLFVWHTGEEHGGWGAKYFTQFPPVPVERIVAQLNVDMIGRSRRPGDDTEKNRTLTGPDEVYLVGASRVNTELSETIARVNGGYLKLSLNLKYDDPSDPERIYERSDHYQYAQKGIPVAFFFTGLHEDYHQPSDEVDRIDFVKLQKVARTVLAVAWDLATPPVAQPQTR